MLEHIQPPVGPNSSPTLRSDNPVQASRMDAVGTSLQNVDGGLQELSPDAEERIEDFLDQVCAPLVGLAPYPERRGRRSEMRAHLENTIAAHLELGSDLEEAVSFALQRFGDARKLGQIWRKECLETLYAARTPSPRNATRIAVRTFGVGMVAVSAAIALLESLPYLHHANRANHIQLLLLFGFPLVAGWISGRRVRSRPVLGALCAQLPIMAAFVPTFAIFLTLFSAYHPSIGRELLPACLCVTGMLTPIGCAGAFVGNRLRWKPRRRALSR